MTDMRRALIGANLFLMFLLELGVLVGAAFWGFTLSGGLVTRLAAGVLAPALFVLMWALFGAAANARFPLTGWWRVGLEVIWFGGGAMAWAVAATPALGIAFFVLWGVNATVRIVAQGGLQVRVGK
ncbi:YrdB family protein [Nocardia amikacinitolerans]|uniref:YrdB family protein n=1 Tax=Nocardia amikacinitolerans TaxID=756689 RepID=UPI0020A37F4D|nr:YrdB family protein [Nocardia amikacinitolerans]